MNAFIEEEMEMGLQTKLVQRLNITHPIFQAPMAGGITTTALVAAVSNEGGLGQIGAGYLSADALRFQIQEVKQQTKKPFGVNVFIPEKMTTPKQEIEHAYQRLQPFLEKLGVTQKCPLISLDVEQAFYEQIEVILQEKVPVCSFTFGIPSETVIQQLKENQTFLIGTATTVEEALKVERSGVDAVVLQGSEAGGHRGTFSKEEGMIGLMSLIPQATDVLRIPVIAAGGIMDHRGIKAARVLGAEAVQMGTAFLTTEESGAHALHKQAVLQAKEENIVLTKAFSGKKARGVENEFIQKMAPYENHLPPYPIQNTLTKGLRKEAAKKQNKEFMSLWCGQSPRLSKRKTVQTLMKELTEPLQTKTPFHHE